MSVLPGVVDKLPSKIKQSLLAMLCRQIGRRNRARNATHTCFLPLVCRHIARTPVYISADPARFLPPICWHNVSTHALPTDAKLIADTMTMNLLPPWAHFAIEEFSIVSRPRCLLAYLWAETFERTIWYFLISHSIFQSLQSSRQLFYSLSV